MWQAAVSKYSSIALIAFLCCQACTIKYLACNFFLFFFCFYLPQYIYYCDILQNLIKIWPSYYSSYYFLKFMCKERVDLFLCLQKTQRLFGENTLFQIWIIKRHSLIHSTSWFMFPGMISFYSVMHK